MVEIERDVGFGRPLEAGTGTGDVGGCRKV